MARKDLTREQQEAVAKLVLDVVESDFGGNATACAKAFGVSQSAVSQVLARARQGHPVGVGPGMSFILPLIEHRPEGVADALGLTSRGVKVVRQLPPPRPELPNLEAAIESVEGNVSDEAVAYAKAMREHWRVDRTFAQWIHEIARFQQLHEVGGEPLRIDMTAEQVDDRDVG